jgi:hypothetical protein
VRSALFLTSGLDKRGDDSAAHFEEADQSLKIPTGSVASSMLQLRHYSNTLDSKLLFCFDLDLRCFSVGVLLEGVLSTKMRSIGAMDTVVGYSRGVLWKRF